MLRQASVSDLLTGRLTRGRKRYVVITMRRYPRFVRRELRDEYVSEMAPERGLFEDWLALHRRTGGYRGIFDRVRYESRFTLSDAGLEHLARLSALAAKKEVYLVCQCPLGEQCHRELLLLLAREWLGARTEEPRNRYPIFEERIRSLRGLRGVLRSGT